MTSVISVAIEECSRLAPEGLIPSGAYEDHYSMVVRTGAPVVPGKLTVLLVRRGRRHGGFVLKVAREKDITWLNKEADALIKVGSLLRGRLRAYVSEMLCRGSVAGYSFTLQTLLPGRPLSGRVIQKLMCSRHISQAVDWAASLASSTLHTCERSSSPQELCDFMRRRESECGVSVLAKIDRATRIASRLGGAFPRVVQHGDFWFGNMLFQLPMQLTGVVDWECCDVDGCPGSDCVSLLLGTGLGESGIAAYLGRYCRLVNHPLITPEACAAHAILDRVRVDNILSRQWIERGIPDWMSAGRLISRIPL